MASIQIFDTIQALKADRAPRRLSKKEKERQKKVVEYFEKHVTRVKKQ